MPAASSQPVRLGQHVNHAAAAERGQAGGQARVGAGAALRVALLHVHLLGRLLV